MERGAHCFLVLCFLSRSYVSSSFEAPDGADSREGATYEVPGQPGALIGAEVAPRPAQQAQETPVSGSHRVEVLPAGKKMVIDEPHDVEPVSHACTGEVFANDAAIG